MKTPKKTSKTTPAAPGFSSDRPIGSARHDLLGRSKFAECLAASIRGWKGKDSLVIALHGVWGTGKTSVKNMTLENLRKGRARKAPQIVEFSPWQVSGTGSILGSFFHELGIALGTAGHDEEDTKRAKALASYAKRITLFGYVAKAGGVLLSLLIPDQPELGALASASGAGLEQSGQVVETGAAALNASKEAATKSLADLKKELGECLTSLERSILIVIDDIDRLTTEEILQVFQLVKVNADFPNLVYLLLFERSIVEKALDQVSGGRGHEFLQKIVQVDFHIPHAHRKSVEKVLFAGMDALLKSEPVQALLDRPRWSDLYVDGIDAYFQNLRHVYRFLSSLSFHISQFQTSKSLEVNPIDLIGLEALRVFEPGLYEKLPSAKRILTRDEGKVLFPRIKQDEVDRVFMQLLAQVPAERHAMARTVLSVIFPPINQSFDNDEGVRRYKQQWLRERRVCHSDLFDKFFALAVAEDDLAQAELDRLLSLTSDRNGFTGECRALLGRGMLDVAFERLDAYKDQIPLENMPPLISALCELSEGFPERQPGLFEQDLNAYAWRLVYFGLRREPDLAKRLSILKDAFLQSSGLPLPVDIVGLDQREPGETESRRERLLDQAGWEELKLICVDKIRRASTSEQFLQRSRLLTFLFKWFGWGDRAEVRAWLAERVKDEKGAVWLLRTLLLASSSTGMDGTRIYHHTDLRLVEQFSDLALVTELTRAAKPDDLQGLDKTALLEFRKALNRRAEGRPDDDWERESPHD
jgi:predicted KAP-like P-loop ATPase